MNPAEQIILSNLELTRVFFALALLLVSAHIFGYFFQHFKIPRVIGEIFGGFILGPSMLGFAFPQAYNWLFDAFAMEGKLLSLIYWIGLALLMFISGFEIQKSISKDDKKIIVAVLLGSTLIPFVAGWLAPFFYYFSPYVGHAGNLTALTIVIAVAVAVTSIPVISKIFIDLGIVNTRFSKIVLATATIHDVILWVALALATELASGNIISKTSILMNVLITVSFFAVALLVMPRLMRFINGLRSNLLVKSSVSGYILFICLLFAGIASVLNVNVVFGALLAGIVVGMMTGDKFTAARMQIREMGM